MIKKKKIDIISIVNPKFNSPDLRGPDLRGPDLRGPGLRGPGSRGPDLRGPGFHRRPPFSIVFPNFQRWPTNFSGKVLSKFIFYQYLTTVLTFAGRTHRRYTKHLLRIDKCDRQETHVVQFKQQRKKIK